jgi:hypothetical protein
MATSEEAPGPGQGIPGYGGYLEDSLPADPGLAALKSALIQVEYGHLLDEWVSVKNAGTTAKADRTALAATRSDSGRANEAALLKSVHDAYIASAQAAVDRSLTRANVVTASVATISTLYTGLLALVYVNSNTKHPFTAGAMIPALFLGLSLFLVASYAAMIRRTLTVGPLLPTGIGGTIVETRLITFLRWSFASVYARARVLHAGIVSLGVAVVTLPSPFAALRIWEHWTMFGVGLFLVLLGALPEIIIRPKQVPGEIRRWWNSWREKEKTDKLDGCCGKSSAT